MHNQKFPYKAKDLIKPLDELVLWLEDQHSKIELELTAIPIAKTKHAIGPVSPDQRKQNELRSRMASCNIDIRTAKDWLRECQRKPKALFELDFHDLRWIYQHQNNA